MDVLDALNASTAEFRKGAEVVEEAPKGGVQVTHVYGMPHYHDAPAGMILHDLVFIKVGVDPDAAERVRDVLEDWLRAYPEPERIAGGPSYIELGAQLGSQDYALRLMALGAQLDLWKLITPGTFGFNNDAEEARMMAGRGMVMISGWKDSA
jgi:hypothetical protein